MHPEYTAQNHFFKYPAQVFVNFSNPYTFKIAASVITSLSVDYHGDGGPYYFKDNRPYSVNLNFQLQEIAINTRKEIREGR